MGYNRFPSIIPWSYVVEDNQTGGKIFYHLSRKPGTEHDFLLSIDTFDGGQGSHRIVEIRCTEEEALAEAKKLVSEKFH